MHGQYGFLYRLWFYAGLVKCMAGEELVIYVSSQVFSTGRLMLLVPQTPVGVHLTCSRNLIM